jgi:hypothetical protein
VWRRITPPPRRRLRNDGRHCGVARVARSGEDLRASGELVNVTRIGRQPRNPHPAGSRRLRSLVLAPVVLVVTALAAAGCDLIGGSTPDPTTPASPTAEVTPTGSVQPSVTGSQTPLPELLEFSTEGAGPYRLNNTLAQLQGGQPGLADVGPITECPGNTMARGVGTWAKIEMRFRADGRLYLLINRDQAIPTPSGAYLGWTLADLPDGRKGLVNLYSQVTHQTLTNGPKQAFWVQTLGGGGILFELNESGEVDVMYAGLASFLRSTFNAGQPFC